MASRTIICSSDTIVLTNKSTGSPTTYSWSISPTTFSFVNGTNASSSDPQVYFTASGTYSVTLIASNGLSSDTLVKSAYIHSGGTTLPFVENWEDTNTYINWFLQNPDNGITWGIYQVGGNSPGNRAIGMDNYNYSASNTTSQIDYLLVPPLNLSSYTAVDLDFEHAYARYSSSYEDSLAISVSTDCGVNWTRVAYFRENGTQNWATVADQSSSFTPAASSDWCDSPGYATCKTVSLNSAAGYSDVRIRFENMSGYGNNLYIDNINITGVNTTIPVAEFTASSTSPCQSDTVQFTDQSTNNPTSWNWSFSPSSVNYVNGTTASSQHPEVVFNASGSYSVTLIATNTDGSDTLTKSSYVQVTQPVTPAVSISASTNTICSGTTVSFSATPVNGGSSPSYQWKVNGANAGTNSNSFSSSTLSNGDSVYVVMTSGESCVSMATATSSAEVITVNPLVTPAVSISASDTTFCAGISVTFTAVGTNGGSNPTYQWKVNGNNAGSSTNVFVTNTLSNNDAITCVFGSSENCASPAAVTSSGITVTVNPLPNVSLSLNAVCEDASAFALTGGSPSGGTYSGTGVSNGMFDPQQAGAGTHSITYSYTDANGCSNSATSSQVVHPLPPVPQIGFNGVVLSTTATGYNYQWNLNGNPIPGATGSTYTVVGNGIYSLTITDPSTGCSNISANYTVGNFSLEDLSLSFGFEVFPNPSSGLVNVHLENQVGAEVVLYVVDAAGKTVLKEEQGNVKRLETVLDLSGLARGMYIIKANVGEHTVQKRMTLQ